MQDVVKKRRYHISYLIILFIIVTGSPGYSKGPELTIPFQVINNFIIIDLKVNGSPGMKFIYDSGSEHSLFFERELAQLFKVNIGRSIKIFGSDLSRPIDATIGKMVNFETDENQMVQADIIILDENIFQLDKYSGLPISGIIGNSFFKHKVLEIDYDRLKLKVFTPNNINPKKSGYHEVQTRWLKGKPYIKPKFYFTNTGIKEGEILFDSGASLGLLLYKNFLDTTMIPDKLIPGTIGMGLGGPLEGYLGRIQKMEIGWAVEENVITNFQQIDTFTLKNDQSGKQGILGNSIISKFNVLLDFNNQKLYLKRNRFGKKSARIDRSGLFIIASGVNLNEYTVKDVIRNSAAMEAGILPGDKILRINGFSSKNYNLGTLNAKFSKPGKKKVRLKILRNGKKFNISFQLRDII